MSLSGAHRAAFRRDVSREGRVFSIRDRAGFPIARDADGTRALPFWSKQSRAEKVVAQVAAYRTFDVVEIDLDDWTGRWLPGLERDGLLVGVNWAGPRATGYDVPPGAVAAWITGARAGSTKVV
jgi:hypothetical protein